MFNQLRAEGLLPDAPIIASVASACIGFESWELRCQIHGHAIKSGTSFDQFIGSNLIDMYSKLGSLKYANIFYLLPYKNLVVLNFMISGYSRNCVFYKSIDTFSETFGLGLIPYKNLVVFTFVNCSTKEREDGSWLSSKKWNYMWYPYGECSSSHVHKVWMLDLYANHLWKDCRLEITYLGIQWFLVVHLMEFFSMNTTYKA